VDYNLSVSYQQSYFCLRYNEGWLFSQNAGFPPAETSATTRAYFGTTNFFGGPAEKSVKSNEKLARVEQLTPDAMFVFIADVCLDSPAVQERLRRLFAGYSEMPPTAFVLFGNFLSQSAGSPGYAESLKVSAVIYVHSFRLPIKT
jgi:DNA polymerase epsilon subunit 2